MHQHHYDIILLGESLASRIAGVLLAKAGQRVLTFQGKHPADFGWVFADSHLVRLLEQLGYRQPLEKTPRLHILNGQTRIELHGRYPLEEEIRRELPRDAEALLLIFNHLDRLGENLESQLLDQAGAPLGSLMDRLRCRAWNWLSETGQRALSKPLCDLFAPLAEASRTWVHTLFSGLTLAPVTKLTLAEGALLWHGLTRPQAMERSRLGDLLARRYQQFHGFSEPLAKIAEITDGRRLQLHDGRECSAGTLIIGQAEALPPKIAAALPPFRRPSAPERWDSGPLNPAPSTVLAPRIIHGENPALRSTLLDHAGELHCLCETPENAPREAVAGELRALFPFSALAPRLLEAPADQDDIRPRRSFAAFPGVAQNPWLRPDLVLCQGTCIFPHLGETGEVLTGYALAGRLARRGKK